MNDVTEIIAILDKSGSMNRIKEDSIGGFNEFVKGQQDLDGEANLTLVLFDTKYETIYKATPINEVGFLDDNIFVPGGWTALFDAVGVAIYEAKERLKNNPFAKVIFVILTDGEENKSKEYTREQVFNMITEQTEAGWEFIFLGANQDAIQAGGRIGITSNKSYTFAADSFGTRSSYNKIGTAVSDFRITGSISDKWKDG